MKKIIRSTNQIKKDFKDFSNITSCLRCGESLGINDIKIYNFESLEDDSGKYQIQCKKCNQKSFFLFLYNDAETLILLNNIKKESTFLRKGAYSTYFLKNLEINTVKIKKQMQNFIRLFIINLKKIYRNKIKITSPRFFGGEGDISIENTLRSLSKIINISLNSIKISIIFSFESKTKNFKYGMIKDQGKIFSIKLPDYKMIGKNLNGISSQNIIKEIQIEYKNRIKNN